MLSSDLFANCGKPPAGLFCQSEHRRLIVNNSALWRKPDGGVSIRLIFAEPLWFEGVKALLWRSLTKPIIS